MRGRCLVVGGHSRGVGKTALVVDLVRSLGWRRVVTVKVSAHRHGSYIEVEEDGVPSAVSSTGRCLAAGAQRAVLCRCPDGCLATARTLVEWLRRDGRDVIVESNRMAAGTAPDLTFFVVSAATADWKATSDACLARADGIVLAPGTASAPARVAPYLASSGGRATLLAFSDGWRVPGLRRWVGERLAASATAAAPRPPLAADAQGWMRRKWKNAPSQTANSPASPNDSTRPPSASHGWPLQRTSMTRTSVAAGTPSA